MEHALNWTVPFTITAPADWDVNGEVTSESALEITAGLRPVLLVFLKEGETPQQWVDRLTTTEALVASEPQPVEVGGAPGHVIDVRLGEDPPPCLGTRESSCYPIHEAFENAVIWVVAAGRPMRIWILDVEGQTVMIATDSRRDRFDDWVARFEEVISSLEWRVP